MTPNDHHPFGSFAEEVQTHAKNRPDHPAVVVEDASLSYRELWHLAERMAASLQREGVRSPAVVAVCAATSVEYVAAFVACIHLGVAVAPLSPALSDATLSAMLDDAGASLIFTDDTTQEQIARIIGNRRIKQVRLNDPAQPLQDWLVPSGTALEPVALSPDTPFNLIYSSGTTGIPKGILQPHGMRWSHLQRARNTGYGPQAITLLGTPLYSNTTLVSALPTLGLGGTVVLMRKFDAGQYLQLAQHHRATHTILVPVQYQRILAHPDFDQTDLSSFRTKFCTSAPFSAALKAETLRRWPGELIELYGMTEGGGRCVLLAHLHPDKLHTVGRPSDGSMLLLDANDRPAGPGETGEIVGRSDAMMTAYHNQPEKTAEVEWFNDAGERYIRTGDIGRFDEDGFLVLLDRKKDMIISGGFNIYPSDIEAVLATHADIADVAVVGVPSQSWGETPVAFIQLRDHATLTPDEAMHWVNSRLEKMQRVSAIVLVDDIPRNPIGKVLKRELRSALAPI